MTSTDQPGNEDLGVLEQDGGEVTLRFTRTLPHPAEKVWRALTQAQHLAAWFPTTITGELAPGAQLTFGFTDVQLPDFTGHVLVAEPPRLLAFTWGDEQLRFELAAGPAGTVLTFTASFAELGRAARDAAGWHVCLELLGLDLDEELVPRAQRERWQAVHSRYVAAFGPQAATIGPPAEFENASREPG